MKTPTSVEIIVKFNDHEIIVYSEEHQVYQILKEMGRKEDTVMWKAMDKKGSYCWIFSTILTETDIALTIRYNDYAWMYICREK